jgi:DNA helicase II / ATP-dependent DNA helicase PcrA
LDFSPAHQRVFACYNATLYQSLTCNGRANIGILLDGLNPDQRRAVTHLKGPLKAIAGAGTGKTDTSTRRFGYLVGQGLPADRILALTFARRAAREFRERALGLLDTPYRGLWIMTFHAFCLRILQEERDRIGGFRVMGEPERRRIIARAVRYDPEAASRLYYIGESGAARPVEDACTLLSRTKDEGIGPADFAEHADQRGVERLRELANVYLGYQHLIWAGRPAEIDESPSRSRPYASVMGLAEVFV